MRIIYLSIIILSIISNNIYAITDTIFINRDIQLVKICDSVFVHISYDVSL